MDKANINELLKFILESIDIDSETIYMICNEKEKQCV